MLQAVQDPIESPLWFPGKPNSFYPLSARAQEIAKSRDELMALVRDLPESEYELSFKDLVERGQNTADGQKSGNPAGKRQVPFRMPSRGRKDKQGSNGVLLNVFVPVSLTRSQRRSRSLASNRSLDFDTERVSERTLPGCWSILCREKSRRKSRSI